MRIKLASVRELDEHQWRRGAAKRTFAGRVRQAHRARREAIRRGERAMNESNQTANDDDPADEPVPAMQQLLDNPFLLLFLGIAMPTVLYIVWGVMEIVGIPVAK
jgi:hypothetical protein